MLKTEVGRTLDIVDTYKYPFVLGGVTLNANSRELELNVAALSHNSIKKYKTSFAPKVKNVGLTKHSVHMFDSVSYVELSVNGGPSILWAVGTNFVEEGEKEIFGTKVSVLVDTGNSNFFEKAAEVSKNLNPQMLRSKENPDTVFLYNDFYSAKKANQLMTINESVPIKTHSGSLELLSSSWLNEGNPEEKDRYDLRRLSLMPESHMRYALDIDDKAEDFVFNFYSDAFLSLLRGNKVVLAQVPSSLILEFVYKQYLFEVFGESAAYRIINMRNSEIQSHLEYVLQNDKEARKITMSSVFQNVIDYIYNYIHYSFFAKTENTNEIINAGKFSEKLQNFIREQGLRKPLKKLQFGMFSTKTVWVID